MKTIINLIILLITFGCSKRDISKGSGKDSLPTTSFETILANSDVLNENIQYIGFVDKFYFSNISEAYVELYFTKHETDVEEYSNIIELADSLIYNDFENSRFKFPEYLSTKYFDLRGLSKLKIYDKENNFYCNSEFLRVEYFDQNMSSSFIAVYKTEKILKDEGYYGISNFDGIFEQNNYTVSKDTILTQKILAKLNEQSPYFGLANNGTHLSFSENDTVLSVVNSENYAYVVLTTNKELKVLYKSSEFENIIDLRIIPLANFKFPYLLTRNVEPETDLIWDNLLIFNGSDYKAMDRQRRD